jgi:hypothetical protein
LAVAFPSLGAIAWPVKEAPLTLSWSDFSAPIGAGCPGGCRCALRKRTDTKAKARMKRMRKRRLAPVETMARWAK